MSSIKETVVEEEVAVVLSISRKLFSCKGKTILLRLQPAAKEGERERSVYVKRVKFRAQLNNVLGRICGP